MDEMSRIQFAEAVEIAARKVALKPKDERLVKRSGVSALRKRQRRTVQSSLGLRR